MRSTTRAPSALALHSAAWTYAGTCPAELGEGRLSCDLTLFSDQWIVYVRLQVVSGPRDADVSVPSVACERLEAASSAEHA